MWCDCSQKRVEIKAEQPNSDDFVSQQRFQPVKPALQDFIQQLVCFGHCV